MATRSCREKAQKLNEQHQLILSKLLREEDNKYCADCEAKGPRWASWNIGVFICIRCAGIHRNLGVHISRVKSVNLDQWTPEQIQCMQDMGNTKARLLYEANLPENFRRPQTDQAVEFFIRDKYEKKKYYDKNAIAITNWPDQSKGEHFNSELSWISSSDAPLQPLVSSPSLQATVEKNKLEKEKEKKKEEKKKEKEPEKPVKPLTTEKLQKKEDQQLEPKKSTSPKKAAEPTVDLLGLDGPAEAPVTNGNTTTVPSLNDDLDIFGPMISNPLPATVIPPAQGTPSIPAAATLSTVISGDLDLFTEQATKSEEVAKKQLSKDSILSLYGTGTIQQQSTPGVFMGPTNIPFTSQAPTAFQGFPSMGVPVPAPAPAAPGLLGNVMGQSASMMVGMPMPNGFMGNAQTGVMPLPPNVVGPQGGMVGQMGAPQSKFGLPQAQQPQWNLSQMNQQMAGMSISSTNPTVGFGQPPNTTAGWSGSSSGQTLSTQLWK
ncbi:stromal membrane-associated protein 1 isoform X1 [Canis lupus dingo]|uniref:stromal membrane-associated protein 1 isoform X1 n=2 Tax=Canis lupus dingo TaxID=286419 RepID=UPI0006B3D646|nr:stromal membrane-associated protein 1 isoform X1 [Canis lupus dingo]XP_038538573.1 stromal membrane-associated protein 1 isoform X1 [Canis lupus familiaris]|eukprot:XP_013973489.1 stromal membrane-associated protein 1 isoform X1 [Canis lupus familiaris]